MEHQNLCAHHDCSFTIINVAELTFWGKNVILRGYKNAYVYFGNQFCKVAVMFTLIVETLLSYYRDTHIQCRPGATVQEWNIIY